MKKLLVFMVAIFCTFSCCKKKYEKRYPEDTENTYATPTERLCNKWWVLDSASLNGINYTDTILNNCGGYALYINNEEQNESGFKFRYSTISILTPNKGFSVLFLTNSDFTSFAYSDADGIFHHKDTVYSYVPFLFKPYSAVWEIRKLSNSMLKLQYSNTDTLLINYYKPY